MREPPEDNLYSRNLPTGVTGIPRLAEWDAVVLVELPELAGEGLAEFELDVPADGPVAARAGARVPSEALERIAAELDTRIDRPYEARAVLSDGNRYTVGARTVRQGETIDLPPGLPASSIEVARAPDGERQTWVDGEPVEPADEELYASALELLERHGEEQFESFVARADKADGGRWNLTVDPL